VTLPDAPAKEPLQARKRFLLSVTRGLNFCSPQLLPTHAPIWGNLRALSCRRCVLTFNGNSAHAKDAASAGVHKERSFAKIDFFTVVKTPQSGLSHP
jgi:hypothetical protein